MPFRPEVLLAQQSGMMEWVDAVARTPLSSILIFGIVLTAIRIGLSAYMKSVPKHFRFGLYSAARVLNDLLDAVLYAAIIVFMVVRPFAIQTFLIPTGSMIKTLLVRDMIVANKAVYRYSDPKVGDIVVFRPPAWGIPPDMPKNSDYIKRCVGVPGDLVEIRDSQLYRNGQPAPEPFLNEKSYRYNFKLVNFNGEIFPLLEESGVVNGFSNIAKYQLGPDQWLDAWDRPAVKIPEGYYLMMGDNRNNSLDGRFWGLVPRRNIVGRCEFVWLPLNRIHKPK
ncbi:MAG TPA: signal peptidase I [Fimbriimonadaceae bacterium]|nr:signal peptidase I [Fimbriimonadaceae bacterium]HRJ33690.1 signal peptidase I [Fimbriimonadaceae bacterium]